MAHIAAGVAELVKLFERSDLTELSMEGGGRRLFLRKGEGLVAEAPVEAELVPAAATVAIKAHMVGVFYWGKDRQAKPSAAPRQRLEKGQVVGFIEAMDIMNEVEAGQAGYVLDVPVSSGQPVEYGQALVVLQPD